MKKISLICISLLWAAFTLASPINNEDSIKAVLNRLSHALTAADKKFIEGDFSPDFSLSVASYPLSAWYLDRILEAKQLTSVTLESIVSSGQDTTLVNIEFISTDGKQIKSIAAFDKNQKLLFIDYFDCLFITSGRYAESEKKGSVPFQLYNENIVLHLRLNESKRVLKFLFDSGADGMAIRRSLADSLCLKTNSKQSADVVGGSLETQISRENRVHLSKEIVLERQNIAIFDLISEGVDGIIGLNLVKKYITEVNFDDKEFIFYSFGNHKFPKHGKIVPISLPHSVIMMPATLNIAGKKDVSGNFVFDTGAHYHFIGFEKFVRKNRLLLSGFKNEGQSSTVSMGVVTPVFNGKAVYFQFGENIRFENMPITLQASTGRTDQRENIPDGSIGVKLLGKFNFTIDLLRKVIHFTPIK